MNRKVVSNNEYFNTVVYYIGKSLMSCNVTFKDGRPNIDNVAWGWKEGCVDKASISCIGLGKRRYFNFNSKILNLRD